MVLGVDLAPRGDSADVDRPESVGAHPQSPFAIAAAGPPGATARPDQALELLGHRGPLLGEAARDLSHADELGEMGVHRLHPDRAGGLDRRVDLVGLPLADQVADRGGRDQDLAGDDAARAVGRGQQLLRDDALQGDRELHPDLGLLLGGEDVDDPVDRLRGRLGVKGGEDQVAGLGRGQRGGHRLQVAHLADEDHVGVLAERRLQRAARSPSASAPISRWLTMQLLCMWRNSIGSSIVRMCSSRSSLMMSSIAASEVDLPEPVGPVTSTKPTRLAGELLEHPRQAQRVELGDLVGDPAEGRADRAALEEAVDAEAGHARDGVGEVELLLGLEPLALVVVEEAVDRVAGLLRRERPDSPRAARSCPGPGSPAGTRAQVDVGGAAPRPSW